MKDLTSKTYYDLLGVPQDATVDQIKESYREIARVYHPDSNFYDEILEEGISGQELEVFQTITAAYNILVSIEKRAAYDATLPKGLRGWEEPENQNVQSSENGMPTGPGGKPLRVRKPTFGDLSEEAKRVRSNFGQPTKSEFAIQRPMSELIQLKPSLWMKIKKIVGLG